MFEKTIGNWSCQEEIIKEKKFFNAAVRVEKMSFSQDGETTKISYSVEKIKFLGRLEKVSNVDYIGFNAEDAFKAFQDALKEF